MSTSIQKHEANTVQTPQIEPTLGYFTPLVDVVETSEAFIFQADMPGVKPEDVDITYENGVLTMQGKVHLRQPVDQAYVVKEYGVGHFYRQFTLNTPIDANATTAEIKNGVLELRVPKASAAKAKKIEVKAA